MCQRLDVHGLAFVGSPRHNWRPTHAAVWFGWQRLDTRWPDNDRSGDADHIGQALFGQALTKGVVDAAASIGPHAVFWRSLTKQVAQLLQGNLRFGRKPNVLRNTRFGSVNSIFCPAM